MAETTDQTNPADAGHTTTEFKIASIFASALVVLAGLLVIFIGLQQSFPDVKWIAGVASALGMLATAAMVLGKYVSGRSNVKQALALLEASRNLKSLPAGQLPPSQQVINQELAARLPVSPGP